MPEISKDHLEHLISPYGLAIEKIEFLQFSQNYIYLYRDQKREQIIRISKGRHRTVDQTEAELSWIHHLIKSGIKACAPIPAIDGSLYCNSKIDGELYITTCFEHAPGNKLMHQNAGHSVFVRIGRLVGQMHNATQNCSRKLIYSCPQWNDSRFLKEDFDEKRQFISDDFQASVNQLISDIHNLSKNSNSFGLIHGDLNFGNLYESNGDLWVFDFDNCEYAYFLQDLAVILYDSIYCKALNKFADDGLTHRMKPHWQAVLKGYTETRPLAEINVKYLKKLFLLREAILYVHYQRVLTADQKKESFMNGAQIMMENVEKHEHQVDFEYLFD